MIILGIFILLWGILLYIGGFFEGKTELVLYVESYILEYNEESFQVLNLLFGFFIINASKEMLILEEPHILIINRKKYIISKAITYLIYYYILIILFYAVYQCVFVFLYGFHIFDYRHIGHLLLNATFMHGFTLLIEGKNHSFVKTIFLFILYISLDQINDIKNPFIKIIHFYYPVLDLNYPIFGYGHVMLMIVFLYSVALNKHVNNFS